MFQSFEIPALKPLIPDRLAAFRKAMKDAGCDWYLVPHADRHQNEYLPENAEQLAWLTGFTGSAGFAVVGQEQAILYVDGRYTVQATQQTETGLFDIIDLIAEPPQKHACQFMLGATVGFDPWLLTFGQHDKWKAALEAQDAKLIPVDGLFDAVWTDQPPDPVGKAWLHPISLAGRSAEEKIKSIQEDIERQGTDTLLVTDPASVAWLFNIRGSDVAHNPLMLAFAWLPVDDRPILYCDIGKFSTGDAEALSRLANLKAYDLLTDDLSVLATEKKVHCDPARTAFLLAERIRNAGGTVIAKPDPVAEPRSKKNLAEIAGARHAHHRDGLAMIRFLAWLDRQPAGSITEIKAAEMLEGMRQETATESGSELREIAFDTISGSGPNGAIVHYRVSEASNRILNEGELYLVDSGGQYPDGTTDITRTVAVGNPPVKARKDFTLVLKGHIAIASARFPQGTRGVDLDGFARKALWQAGKDYAHGTGHGVGSNLNVHEGPQSISRRGMVELLPGMIVSNEPGYYRAGEYGIRIENLVLVCEPETITGGDKPMLGFETLTLCPIDTRLIDVTLLTDEERQWINAYHARVRDTYAGLVDESVGQWLEQATAPV